MESVRSGIALGADFVEVDVCLAPRVLSKTDESQPDEPTRCWRAYIEIKKELAQPIIDGRRY